MAGLITGLEPDAVRAATQRVREEIAAAAQKAGDKDGAEAARAALLKLYVRDPVHLWVRSRLMATTGSTSTE